MKLTWPSDIHLNFLEKIGRGTFTTNSFQPIFKVCFIGDIAEATYTAYKDANPPRLSLPVWPDAGRGKAFVKVQIIRFS
jgi:hypothetical protein